MFKILNTAESDIAHGYGLQARKVEHIKWASTSLNELKRKEDNPQVWSYY